jgi:single-stranded DNA-binding protein
MSSSVLISGKLQNTPATRPTRNGGQVTFFKLRVANGASLEWWDVSTFSDTARVELEGLGEGDALSAVGALRVETYEHNGERRIALKLTADRILPLKPKPKESKAGKATQTAPAKDGGAPLPLIDRGGEFDDSIPF